MQFTKIIVVSAVFTAAVALNAENLITVPASIYLDCTSGVKCIQDKEKNIQKLTVEKYAEDKDGNLMVSASLHYGTVPGDKYPGRGIVAEPETTYAVSFEYQGDVPRFWTGILELSGESFWKDRKRLKSLCLAPKKDEWKKANFTVKTGKNCKKISFYTNLYVNEKYKNFDLKPGQSLLIRNVVIEKK